MLCDSIFSNVFLTQEYIRKCVAYMKTEYGQDLDKITMYSSQNVAEIGSNQKYRLMNLKKLII
jgi:hypothetical protein